MLAYSSWPMKHAYVVQRSSWGGGRASDVLCELGCTVTLLSESVQLGQDNESMRCICIIPD